MTNLKTNINTKTNIKKISTLAEQVRKPPRMKWRGQRFVLDIHGGRPEDFARLTSFFDTSVVRAAVVAKEFGRNKVHPHWQVYFELAKETLKVRTLLRDVLRHEGFHVETARASKESNVAYVYAVDKPHEAGFVEYVKNVAVPLRYQPEKASFWRSIVLRPFQQRLLEIATSPGDRRSIYWIYEESGNTGKTILAEYLHIFHGAVITGGTTTDMKHAIARWSEIVGADPTIIIVDLARSDTFSRDSAKAIESIKNGLFFDGKYESAMAHAFLKPHVFVFSNSSPAAFRGYFSSDRWSVFRITDDLCLEPETLGTPLKNSKKQ